VAALITALGTLGLHLNLSSKTTANITTTAETLTELTKAAETLVTALAAQRTATPKA
jgi:hypothetical protein